MAVKTASTEVKRVGKFGIVGILNTVLDFAIFNVLHFQFGLGTPIPSNIISTTCAMLFSFTVNKRMVFEQRRGSVAKQAILFFAVTAFGLYVLQTGVILFLKEIWNWPLELAVQVVNLLRLNSILSYDFVTENGAKAAGTLVSMTWNYIMYKKFVFKG